jgi:DNA mismatch repair protein MSH5
VQNHTPVPLTSDALPRNNGVDEDPDGNDALNEVIMAVDLRERNTVGCCYYIARDEKLYFMEDVKLGGVDVVDACTLLHRVSMYQIS